MRDLREIVGREPTAICSVGTAISAAVSLGTSYLSSQAAKKSANGAANNQMAMFQQMQQNLSPWMSTGSGALSQLAMLFGLGGQNGGVPNTGAMTSALENFPGYQFGLGQGMQALDRSAASRGLLLSGGQLKDAQAFGQGYAMQNAWQPYISMLSGLSSLGENAAAGVGQAGIQTGANMAGPLQNAGQAQSNMYQGLGNTLQQSLSNFFNQGSSGLGSGGFDLGGMGGGDFNFDPSAIAAGGGFSFG